MSVKELRASIDHKITLDGGPRYDNPYVPTDYYEFLTSNGSFWKFARRLAPLPPPRKDLPSEEDLLNFQLAISPRRTAIPEDLYNSPHSRAIQFCLQNWWRIRDLIMQPPEAPPVPARCYAEVDFEGIGRADFVGMFADGSIAVVEFGHTPKAPQVAEHAFGLYPFVNGDTMPVFPFTASYSSIGRNSYQINISQVGACNITIGRNPDVTVIPAKQHIEAFGVGGNAK